jgi:hypothetical protein
MTAKWLRLTAGEAVGSVTEFSLRARANTLSDFSLLRDAIMGRSS